MKVPPPVAPVLIAAVLIAAVLCAVLATAAMAQPAADIGWPHYGNDPGGARYSTATQIDRTNVGQLRLAWTYRTGALGRSAPLDRKAAFEASPRSSPGATAPPRSRSPRRWAASSSSTASPGSR